MTRLLALLALTSLAAQAQTTAQRTLDGDPWCARDLGGRHAERPARACEVREALLPATALDLDATPDGSVTVRRWDRPDVLVRARVLASAPSADDARRSVRGTRLQVDRGTVRARAPGRGDGARWTTVSFEVFAPRRTRLTVRTLNGAIQIHGIEGEIRARAVNGAVALAGVGGDVRVETVNGPVSVALEDGPWSGAGLAVQTTNGSVSLSLPGGFSGDLSARTQVGRIALAGLDVARLDRQQGRWAGDRVTARLGRGGPPVRVATTNGSVSIRGVR